MRGMWQWSNLWVQAKEWVCGLHLNNIETMFPRLRPQVHCELSGKAIAIKVKTIGAWSLVELWLNNTWWCFVQICEEEGVGLRVCISRCTGGGGTHSGPLQCRFLRWPEKGRNQVRLFLRPDQSITTKEDMCSAPTSRPSPLNPTSMAGHRQPIKPGLGGYLHTHWVVAKKFLNTPNPALLPSHNSFHYSFLSLIPTIFLFVYFIHSHFYILPLLLPFSLCRVSSWHNGASRNYSFCWGSSANSHCLLPTSPSYLGSCVFRCYDNEMCSITMTKLCVFVLTCDQIYVNSRFVKIFFAWIRVCLDNFVKTENSPSPFTAAKQIRAITSICTVTSKYLTSYGSAAIWFAMHPVCTGNASCLLM